MLPGRRRNGTVVIEGSLPALFISASVAFVQFGVVLQCRCCPVDPVGLFERAGSGNDSPGFRTLMVEESGDVLDQHLSEIG